MSKKLTYRQLKENVSEMEDRLTLKDKEVNKLKSSFLSNISHEIRTPMNVIVGFSYLLCDQNYNQDQKEFFIGEINKNSKELLRLIDNIILTAKIETDDIKLNMDVCDIQSFMEDLYIQVQKFLKANAVQNTEVKFVHNSRKSHYQIFTDKEKVKRAMFNMVENITKLSANNCIELGYKIIDNKIVEFYINEKITDLKSTTIDRNNDEFINGSSSKSDFYDTRVGLTISDKLIRLLGGKLRINSSKDSGFSFKFSLPLLIQKPI